MNWGDDGVHSGNIDLNEWFKGSNEPCGYATSLTWDVESSDYCVVEEYDSLDLDCIAGSTCTFSPSTKIRIE